MPRGAPLLDVQRTLDGAENPGTRLCTLCGCAQELTPMPLFGPGAAPVAAVVALLAERISEEIEHHGGSVGI